MIWIVCDHCHCCVPFELSQCLRVLCLGFCVYVRASCYFIIFTLFGTQRPHIRDGSVRLLNSVDIRLLLHKLYPHFHAMTTKDLLCQQLNSLTASRLKHNASTMNSGLFSNNVVNSFAWCVRFYCHNWRQWWAPGSRCERPNFDTLVSVLVSEYIQRGPIKKH